MGAAHLIWILAAAAAGFVVSVLLGDLPGLPVDAYYLCYFAAAAALFAAYVRLTRLPLAEVMAHRWGLALALGALGGLVMIAIVLRQPAGAGFTGAALGGALAWRGVIYGGVDGLLLSGFPWLVAWRAFGAEQGGWGVRVGASLVALVGVLVVTSAYHAGYRDFRGPKLVHANIGNVIMSAPTLLSGNPLASALTHATMHAAAVIHNPQTDLFLPPHRLERGLSGRPSPEASP